MLNRIAKWLVIPMALSLSACGAGTYLNNRFSIDGSQATSLVLDASTRVILVTKESQDAEQLRGAKKGGAAERNVVCAEPSPDVFALFAGSGGLSLGKKDTEGSGEVNAQLVRSMASIARRTATTQLLRDGLYRACEAYMNGVIGHDEYRSIVMGYDEILITLVALESLAPQPAEIPPKSDGAELQTPKAQDSSAAKMQYVPQAKVEEATSAKAKESIPPFVPETVAGTTHNRESPGNASKTLAGQEKPSARNSAGAKAKTPITTPVVVQQDNAEVPVTFAKLQPEVARQIHQVVRDYYCFQLGLKGMFYAQQPNGRALETDPSERPTCTTGENRCYGLYGNIPPEAIKALCKGDSVAHDSK